MISWIEFLIKKRKGRKKFVTPVIHVDERRFQVQSLFGDKIINGNIVRTVFI